MGKQSSRIYYQGKDHKDIYFQGKYHEKIYKGNVLVWEKIYDKCFMYLVVGKNSAISQTAILFPDTRHQCITGFSNFTPISQAFCGVGKFTLLTKKNNQITFLTNNGDMFVESKIGNIGDSNVVTIIAFSPYIFTITIEGRVNVIKLNNKLEIEYTKNLKNGTYGKYYYNPFAYNIKYSSDKYITYSNRKAVYDGGFSILVFDKNGDVIESEIDTSELYQKGHVTWIYFAAIIDKTAFLVTYTNTQIAVGWETRLIVYKSTDYMKWEKITTTLAIAGKNAANFTEWIVCRNKTFYIYSPDGKMYITKDFITFQSKELKNLKINVVGTNEYYALSMRQILGQHLQINNCMYFNGKEITQDTDDFVYYTNNIVSNEYEVHEGYFAVYIDNLADPDESKCFIIDQDNYNLEQIIME